VLRARAFESFGQLRPLRAFRTIPGLPHRLVRRASHDATLATPAVRQGALHDSWHRSPVG
jgi:hypothetical protein